MTLRTPEQVAGAIAAILVVIGGGIVFLRSQGNSRSSRIRALQHAINADPADASVDRQGMAALWTQMSRAADQMGAGTGLYTRIERVLDRAGWLLRPGELLLAILGAALVGGLIGTVISGPLLGLLLAAVGPILISLVLTRRADRLRDRIDAQLPDVLDQLAGSLRAGYSLGQSIEAAIDAVGAPMSSQLARVIAETRVGVTLDDALVAMAERAGSTDLRWTVRAMAIQSRTGGRLSDLLAVLADFMREREEVRREVKALTADGRISGVVLIALPFVVGGALLVLQPTYLLPLVTDPLGWVLMGGAAVLLALGILGIRVTTRVEV